MVVGFDRVLEADAEQIAGPRHESLEPAEIQADDESMLWVQLLHGKSLADRNGEGIHGEAYSQKK